MTHVLSVEALRAGYGSTEILHGVGLRVAAGEIVAVLGRNGVGKTTLVKSIMGVIRLRGGRVEIGNEVVSSRPAHEIARRGVAYVPQEGGVFDELTVAQNFEIVLERREVLAQVADRAFAAFPVLAERLGQKAGTLSGGERKMLMAARVLVQRPKLIVVDEITEGVQPANVAHIGRALREERDRGVGILIIEQKLDFALALASRFAVLKHGEVVVSGDVADDTAATVTDHLVL